MSNIKVSRPVPPPSSPFLAPSFTCLLFTVYSQKVTRLPSEVQEVILNQIKLHPKKKKRKSTTTKPYSTCVYTYTIRHLEQKAVVTSMHQAEGCGLQLFSTHKLLLYPHSRCFMLSRCRLAAHRIWPSAALTIETDQMQLSIKEIDMEVIFLLSLTFSTNVWGKDEEMCNNVSYPPFYVLVCCIKTHL